MSWSSNVGAALTALALVAVNASAAPVIFFGEDLGLGEDVRLPSHPNADAARANFLASLTGVVTQTFESFQDGATAPLQLDFGASGFATLRGTGFIRRIPSGTDGVGRYPISGSQYFRSGDAFSVVFSKPQAAFGFYGVDLGDFAGQLTVTYADGTSHLLQVPHTINGPGGSVIYFGFIDVANPFSSVSFGDTAPGTDFFAFDDFTIGTPAQVTLPPNGTVSSVQGTVQAIVKGVPVAVTGGFNLAKGIELRTGANGQVQSGCGNGNGFTLGSSASVFLGASVCDPAAGGSVDVTQGLFQVQVQGAGLSARSAASANPMDIRTPVSQATPAGTGSSIATLYTQVGNTGTAITSVQSGSAVLTDPRTGATATLSAGGIGSLSGELPPMVAAVLPASRSIQLGVPASAFATILNAGNTVAIVCKIAPSPPFENVPFSFAATDPITNQVVGETSTPVVIPAGVAQSFVFDFRPDVAIFPPADVQLSLGCAGTSAPVVIGLNTLLLSASPTPVPDIIALAATATPGLTLVIPTSTNVGAFAVATSNVGTSGTITVTADTGSASPPVAIAVCQTNSASNCLATPASSVTTTIGAGQTPTFSIFVTATGIVTFDPAHNRIFVRFKDGAITRGSTSVAVRTQ
jgi:hypothetical protein